MSCEFSSTTVHGYFDGELDAARSVEFERHLEQCSECQATLEGIESLRRTFQRSNLYEPASDALRERVMKNVGLSSIGSARPAPYTRPWFFAAAAILLTVAAFATAFLVSRRQRNSYRITAEVIDAHVRSLQPGHLTDVQSTDQHTVKPWFDGKLDFIPPVADYSKDGFPLVGGRLDVIDGHDVAALVYSRRKHLISVFVWPERQQGEGLGRGGARQGYNWRSWQSGDMRFCAVSDAAAADLDQLKALISP